jgi:predicted TIM-barrel fold metal-dependent hydrolase
MKTICMLSGLLLAQLPAGGQTPSKTRLPTIDVHLHATTLKSYIVSQVDTRWWPKALKRPSSDEEVIEKTLAALKQYNVVRAVTSEELPNVERWMNAAPNRIIPGYTCPCVTPEEQEVVRRWAGDGRIKVIGEIVWQYFGVTPSDPKVAEVWKIAEDFGLPMGIHMGLQPAGWSQTFNPDVRIGNGNPLYLEDALVKHPKARVYVMHAGWPYLDGMVAMLYQYPELYVDLAWIDWYLPREEFYAYLKRLVGAGFGKRIMYGSDQMIWPDAIGIAIERIESAPFLTASQKRDILYENAVRFLKLNLNGKRISVAQGGVVGRGN